MFGEKGGNYEFYHIFRGENTIYSVSIIFSCTGFLSSLFIRGGRSVYFPDDIHLCRFSNRLSMVDLSE